jgi:glutaredoxin
MEKSKPKRTNKQLFDSHSILSINHDEPLVNNTAHHLFILAVKRAREERQQAKIRQKNSKLPTIWINKKKKLTIDDIDRLFEEKRLRTSNIKNDLYDLYQKSTNRIRSMLDIHQIDQFIQMTEHRKMA